jgi:hypothetical protein
MDAFFFVGGFPAGAITELATSPHALIIRLAAIQRAVPPPRIRIRFHLSETAIAKE